MAFNLTVTAVRLLGTAVQNVSRAIVSYEVVLPPIQGIGPRPNLRVSFPLALTPGQAVPGAQELANAVGSDVNTRFGGLPDVVVVQGADYTPVLP